MGMKTIARRHFLTGTVSALVLGVTPRLGSAQMKLKPGETDALAVIDVQNCFLPGGTLPVPQGDQIIPLINRLAPLFRNVVVTQDWHTPGHA